MNKAAFQEGAVRRQFALEELAGILSKLARKGPPTDEDRPADDSIPTVPISKGRRYRVWMTGSAWITRRWITGAGWM